jgi:DNA-binding transcriptional LysR family regulator
MQQLDMNLLFALDTLLQEQSVTRAAERLGLSVPAMSRTLLRLRKMMGDPLLVRAGMRLVPTYRALELQPKVSALVEQTRSLVQSKSSLSLHEMERTFTVRCEDSTALFTAQLYDLMARSAPKVKLRILGATANDIDELREGTVHLVISATMVASPEIKQQRLLKSTLVGVARPDHPIWERGITPRRFASFKHVNASRMGRDVTPIDHELAKLKLRRDISLVVPSFHAALVMATTSLLIATIPQHIMDSARSMSLRTFKIPLTLPPIAISQAWHPRFEYDEAHRYLRECVREVCRESLARVQQVLSVDG